jgi:hypothetical protein
LDLAQGSALSSALAFAGDAAEIGRAAEELQDLPEENWQGWMDLNHRMTESESVALPLGDTPVEGRHYSRMKLPQTSAWENFPAAVRLVTSATALLVAFCARALYSGNA